MKLYIIETSKCVFVSEVTESWNTSRLDRYYFDGESPEVSFKENWFKIKNIPSLIEQEQRQPDINIRYELKDKSLASDKIKEKLSIDEVTTDSDGYWTGDYAPLSSLYIRCSDKQPPIKVPVEFTIADHKIITSEIDFFGFKYPVQRTQRANEGFIDLTQEEVAYDILDQLQLPDLLLPLRPAQITSEQSYKIIRKHIQDNINPKVAHITSDYDFCFTVKRKISVTPFKVTYDENNTFFGKKKKPKYVTKMVDIREVELFEMTYYPKCYQGYTPIEGFKGETLRELKNNIDSYLSELMKEINRECINCPKCNGMGIVTK